MKSIIQDGDSRLREIAKDVPLADIKSQAIQNVLKDMEEALNRESDGVAIAAPQIGVSLRIFLVSEKIFDKTFLDEDGMKKTAKKKYGTIAFINPKILKISKKTEVKNGEGCLSVRWLYGNVRRALNVTVEAYNEKGEKIKRGAGGILAHIFQHEIDHLDGILFIDKATDIHEMTPESELEKK